MGINAAEIGINVTLYIINVEEIGINVAEMSVLEKVCGVINQLWGQSRKGRADDPALWQT
jgi:hypothetical protein